MQCVLGRSKRSFPPAAVVADLVSGNANSLLRRHLVKETEWRSAALRESEQLRPQLDSILPEDAVRWIPDLADFLAGRGAAAINFYFFPDSFFHQQVDLRQVPARR